MRIDQPGHHQAAACINGAIDLVLVCRKGAHVDDVIALDENAAVLDEPVFIIECDEVSVGDE